MHCILAVVLAQTPDTGAHYPTRLRKIFQLERPRTSRIEWTVSWFGGYDDGLVERHVTRTVGQSVWESNLGDENQYHEARFDAHPPGLSDQELQFFEIPKKSLSGTRNSMIHEGQAWYLPSVERPLTGFVGPVGDAMARAPVDPVTVGLRPSWTPDASLSNPFGLSLIYSKGFESATFREGLENGRPTVSADYGAQRLLWTFDDSKGGLPVEAALYGDYGRLQFYSRTEWQEIAGRWIPLSVRFYTADSPSPYKTVDVQRATFDEPWHVQEITPDDLGSVYGTEIWTPTDVMRWNGAELISTDDYWDLVYLYDALPDPRILELVAEGLKQTTEEYKEYLRRGGNRLRETYRMEHGEEPWLVKKSPKEKDEWDVYVEQFLAKHKLPAPGVQRANEIRDQSKKLRDAYRRKNESKLREAKKEGDPRKIAEYEGIEKRIFDNVLVRELNKLVQVEKDSPKKEP